VGIVREGDAGSGIEDSTNELVDIPRDRPAVLRTLRLGEQEQHLGFDRPGDRPAAGLVPQYLHDGGTPGGEATEVPSPIDHPSLAT